MLRVGPVRLVPPLRQALECRCSSLISPGLLFTEDASRQKTAESPGPRMAISKMLSNVVCEFSDPSNKKARLAPASLDVPIPPLVFRLPDV